MGGRVCLAAVKCVLGGRGAACGACEESVGQCLHAAAAWSGSVWAARDRGRPPPAPAPQGRRLGAAAAAVNTVGKVVEPATPARVGVTKNGVRGLDTVDGWNKYCLLFIFHAQRCLRPFKFSS